MTEPVSAAEAARHLRIDADDPGYADLDAKITAARQHVEQFLGVSIVQATRIVKLDAFPADREAVPLPNGPVVSLTSISYVDTDGATQAVTGAVVKSTDFDDILVPAYGTDWPTARDQVDAVTITYTAGMMSGSPLTLANENIKAGILLVLGDIWENRESQFVNVAVSVNKTLDRLLHFYRRSLGL